MAPTYLDRILAAHREAATIDARPLDDLAEQCADLPAVRQFGDALRQPGLSVIAEIKRKSPSRGRLAMIPELSELALAYEAGGASALSVLTDSAFFDGSLEDLHAARRACSLPVLRKDFTVSEHDIYDARIAGADAVLLIAATLDDAQLTSFHSLATELGLAALVEVHDEAEIRRALAAGATIIGVNQRDLVTFEVDRQRAEELAELIPSKVIRVAESGVMNPEDAHRLEGAGYDAVLVGEALVTAEDPGAMIRQMRKVDA